MPTDYTAVKGSELPDADGLSDSDLIIIIQAGVTKKVTKSAFETQMDVPASESGPTVVDVDGTDEINVLAGKLLTHMVVIGAEGDSYAVGTTEGGGEILEESTFDSSGFVSFNLGWYFTSNTTIWLTGTFSARFYFR